MSAPPARVGSPRFEVKELQAPSPRLFFQEERVSQRSSVIRGPRSTAPHGARVGPPGGAWPFSELLATSSSEQLDRSQTLKRDCPRRIPLDHRRTGRLAGPIGDRRSLRRFVAIPLCLGVTDSRTTAPMRAPVAGCVRDIGRLVSTHLRGRSSPCRSSLRRLS